MKQDEQLHTKIIDAFIIDWISKYTGVERKQVVGVGLADNTRRWRAPCIRCPMFRGPAGPMAYFAPIALNYLFVVDDNNLVPPTRYAILVGQCPHCKTVYFAKGVV